MTLLPASPDALTAEQLALIRDTLRPTVNGKGRVASVRPRGLAVVVAGPLTGVLANDNGQRTDTGKPPTWHRMTDDGWQPVTFTALTNTLEDTLRDAATMLRDTDVTPPEPPRHRMLPGESLDDYRARSMAASRAYVAATKAAANLGSLRSEAVAVGNLLDGAADLVATRPRLVALVSAQAAELLPMSMRDRCLLAWSALESAGLTGGEHKRSDVWRAYAEADRPGGLSKRQFWRWLPKVRHLSTGDWATIPETFPDLEDQ